MQDKLPEIVGHITVLAGAVVAWAAGESGSRIVSGAAGGVLRLFMSPHELRTLRNGAVAVITGAIFAVYFGPVMLRLIEAAIGEFADPYEAHRTAAFAAGMLGMTGARLFTAIFEVQLARVQGGGANAKTDAE